jgi:hypothetical protein
MVASVWMKGLSPMLRIALIDIVLFALPFILYGAYVVATRGAGGEGIFQGAPIAWLLAAGAGLLLVTMATLVSFSGGKPGGIYHPPEMVDGVVKPGTVE